METHFVDIGKSSTTLGNVTVKMDANAHALDSLNAIADATIEIRKAIETTGADNRRALSDLAGALFEAIDKEFHINVKADMPTPVINIPPQTAPVIHRNDNVTVVVNIPKVYLWGAMLIPTIAGAMAIAALKYFVN